MSNQRLGLAKYLNCEQFFAATFDSIQHAGKTPKVLLKNIYPVNSTGRKIALRKNRIKINNQWVLSDHIWVNLKNTDAIVALNINNELYEITPGEQIMFKAQVATYNISRDNVKIAQKLQFEQTQKQNDELFNDYLSWKKQASYSVGEQLDQIYQNYLNRFYDFDTMKTLQKTVINDFKHIKNQRLSNLKQKQKRRLSRFEKTKAQKIDYELINLSHITLYNGHPYLPTNIDTRLKLDKKRLDDYKYTSFLAAHSLNDFKRAGG